MLPELKKYIEREELCIQSDKLLVAVSGGVDSIVLLDLLHKGGFNCTIAHCNFQLRGNESDQDEEFVNRLGLKYGIATHTIRFETTEFSLQHGISTQMAARELRYKWFAELSESKGYTKVAIAHNANDNIETFHLNLARGTGISGISGIASKSGRIIRPLLWAFRDQISNYCKSNNLSFREDSSNLKSDYKRNYLRHEILPKYVRLNPSYSETMLNNIGLFRESSVMLDFLYDDLIKQIVDESAEETNFLIHKLLELPEPKWFLFRYLSPFGFTSSQIEDITESLNSESGKRFSSESHYLVKDRDNLILIIAENQDMGKYYLHEKSGQIEYPLKLVWEELNSENYIIYNNPGIASLDASKLKFPLEIRKWRKGDSFHPLGMKGVKKLSDYFIDKKISLIEKQQIWLLISGGQIVWVIGQRIDNRFKVSDETTKILRITQIP